MSLGSSLVLQEEISLMGIPSSKMREVGSFCQTIFLDGGILCPGGRYFLLIADKPRRNPLFDKTDDLQVNRTSITQNKTIK
mgnify:CR=1 FL=1